MLTQVQLIHVPVTDQDRAKDFYVDRLGLSVIADLQMGPHGRWLQVAPSGVATSLALVPGNGEDAATVVFESDDLEGDITALRERGVDLPGQIEDMPWARAIQFTDPDGNHLALQTPATAQG